MYKIELTGIKEKKMKRLYITLCVCVSVFG